MVCEIFTNINNIGDLLVWPTSCNYYIYLVVFVTIFITLSSILYYAQKEEQRRGDMISSMGVSAIAVILLALVGTLIKNTDNIPMMQRDIFLYIFASGIVFILIWFFKKD